MKVLNPKVEDQIKICPKCKEKINVRLVCGNEDGIFFIDQCKKCNYNELDGQEVFIRWQRDDDFILEIEEEKIQS